MDIEQLKLILEAATAAGEGATSIVRIWFALQFLELTVFAGLWSGALYGIYKVARTGITAASYSNDIDLVTGDDSSYGREHTLKKLRALKADGTL